MNCYAFRSQVDISVTGEFNVNFTDYQGNPIYTTGSFYLNAPPPATKRQIACRDDILNGGRLLRRGIFWNRFWVDGFSGLNAFAVNESGNMTSSVAGGYPRPWKPNDPYYGRADFMWYYPPFPLEIVNNKVYYSTNRAFVFQSYFNNGDSVNGVGLFQNEENIDIRYGNAVVGQLTLSVS